MKSPLKIGELARHANCPPETIRYYEREGLLPPPARTGGNYRLYDAGLTERLSFIRNCRSLDMTLEEIRQLLRFKDEPDENCGAVNALLDRHTAHVVTRITELQRLEKQLKSLRRLCRSVSTAKDCGILNELRLETQSKSKSKAAVHVGGTHK